MLRGRSESAHIVLRKPPGFHTTAREPKRAHFRVPAFKNTTKNSTRRHPERQKKNVMGGRLVKSAKFWAVRGGEGPVEGGPGESKPTTTTTTTNKPPEMGGGQTQNKCGPAGERGGARRVGSQRVGPMGSGPFSPGLGFVCVCVGFGFRSECMFLGLWGLDFLCSQNRAKTLKLAKIGMAKVGQHIKALKLAKVGQAHNWPKSVKELAKVCLAKVGHDLNISFVSQNRNKFGVLTTFHPQCERSDTVLTYFLSASHLVTPLSGNNSTDKFQICTHCLGVSTD